MELLHSSIRWLLSIAAASPAAHATLEMPQIKGALSNAYNKIETWRLYGPYLQHLERCTRAVVTNTHDRWLRDGYDSLDPLPEADLDDGTRRRKGRPDAAVHRAAA